MIFIVGTDNNNKRNLLLISESYLNFVLKSFVVLLPSVLGPVILIAIIIAVVVIVCIVHKRRTTTGKYKTQSQEGMSNYIKILLIIL